MEEKKKKNEELQSRREFFKKAAKRTLPFLGAVVFGPAISLTTMTSCGCDGCEATCMDDCDSACTGGCYTSCSGMSTDSSCSACSSSCSGSSTRSTCSSCSDSCSNSCIGGATGNSNDSEADGSIDSHEFIDLGLSVKWATCNIGASSPTGFGSYFAFGDPNGYNLTSEYDWEKYYTRNKFSEGTSIEGSQYDPACAQWGKKWRLPTKREWEELMNNCMVEFSSINSIKGLKFKSKKNGKTIFFPAAGLSSVPYDSHSYKVSSRGEQGYYWSSDVTHYTISYYMKCEGTFFFFYMDKEKYRLDSFEMYNKLSIRAVTTGKDNNSGGSGGGNSGECTGSSCKATCSSNCPNGCQTLCGGQCQYSCGGTCSYVSAGSSCSGCARTCSTFCYQQCTLACSSSCMSCCITSAG